VLAEGTPVVYWSDNWKIGSDGISCCQLCDPDGVREQREDDERRKREWQQFREEQERRGL
jgi:hypothetical protein